MQENKFVENTMTIINAIKEHRNKNGNDGIVEQYYKEHGTYKGIEDHLRKIENEEETKS